jgi:glycosyltransferase involved in cell wall biosynthesis
MKKILIITPYFLPGYKAGGPIRSISNLINRYKDFYDFSVITPNKDLDGSLYNGTIVDEWNNAHNSKVFYVEKYLNFIVMLRAYCKLTDIIYLNSLFHFKYSIMIITLNYFKLLNIKKIIIAPRGELAPSALSIKPNKKFFYLYLLKLCKLDQKIFWQATSEKEEDQINIVFDNAKVVIASNISSTDMVTDFRKYKIKKKNNELHVVVVSRIVPIKNLLFSLSIMQNISKKIDIYFDIYGPIEDEVYWDKCQNIIQSLPKNIIVNYKGSLDNSNVLNTIKKYHLYLLPTKGENFGHSIIESFKASCPVLISDQTPWRNLEIQNIGWDVSLLNKKKYIEIIESLAIFSNEKMINMSDNVHAFITVYLNNKEIDTKYEKLFQ